MDIFKIAALAIISAVMCVYLSSGKHREYALMVSIAAGIVILGMSSGYFSLAYNTLNNLIELTNENTVILPLLKIILTAYIAQFASDLCTEAGCKNVATNVEFVSRFIILYLSLPYIISLYNFLNEIA